MLTVLMSETDSASIANQKWIDKIEILMFFVFPTHFILCLIFDTF